MKQIVLNEEEARALVTVLKSTWIQPDLQKAIYNLINRVERELEN